MAWVTRGGRRYYYRTIKTDGRVRSIYVGGGQAGEAAAREQAERTAARQHEREELARLRATTAATTQAIDQLSTEIELLLRAAFITSGWRNHAAGEWRKYDGRHERHPPAALAAGA